MNLNTIYKNSIRTLTASKIPTPELDARILIEHALNLTPSCIFTHPEMLLTNSQYAHIRRLISRRKKGEPVAYITGHKEFYGHDFAVNKSTLIPRPESEWLVSAALESVNSKVHQVYQAENPTFFDANISMRDNDMGSGNFRRRLKRLSSKISQPKLRTPNFQLLDLGTGSGCLGISVIKELQGTIDSGLVAIDCSLSDISPSALRIARKNMNIILNQSSKAIKFIHSDLFANHLLHKKFDLILANLPYVPNSDLLTSNSIKFEPTSAIFADDNGASIIKNFLTQSPNYIADNALILIELDPRNAKSIEKFARKIYPQAKIELKKDLAGLDRYLTIQL